MDLYWNLLEKSILAVREIYQKQKFNREYMQRA